LLAQAPALTGLCNKMIADWRFSTLYLRVHNITNRVSKRLARMRLRA
jgi:hypothetical protein